MFQKYLEITNWNIWPWIGVIMDKEARMKRLLAIVLLIVPPAALLADETQSTFNSSSPGSVAPLDIGPGGVKRRDQRLIFGADPIEERLLFLRRQ